MDSLHLEHCLPYTFSFSKGSVQHSTCFKGFLNKERQLSEQRILSKQTLVSVLYAPSVHSDVTKTKIAKNTLVETSTCLSVLTYSSLKTDIVTLLVAVSCSHHELNCDLYL